MDILGKTAVFGGRIWQDWENTACTDTAGLGSIGFRNDTVTLLLNSPDVPCRIQEMLMPPIIITLESLSHVNMLHVPCRILGVES